MSAAKPQAAAPRLDLYGPIHKALRAFMSHTLVAVGRLDTNDDAEVAVTLEQVRSLLEVLALHLEKENRFVHPALEARRPGSSGPTAHDHVEHEQAFEELGSMVEAVYRRATADRALAVSRLYQRLALFVADNLEHMDVEERDNAAVLWAEYSDKELGEIEAAIVGSVNPTTMAVVTSWMMKALSHAERVGLLQGMRHSSPERVFEGALAIARSNLSTRDWIKLANALAVPAAQAA
jgi:hemerythrin-like domain-containing protein